MSNITANQDGNVFILGQIAQSVGDYFKQIKRYDEAREEYLEANRAYDLVHSSSPDFADAQNNKNIVRNLLNELSNLPPVDDSKPPVMILNDWFLNKFDQAVEAGWQTLESISGTRLQQAVRGSHVSERAMEIYLGPETVILVIELNELENNEIRILLHILPIDEQTYLPENMTLTLLSESGEVLTNIQTGSNDDRIKQSLTGSIGEQFGVKISLAEISVIENFVI